MSLRNKRIAVIGVSSNETKFGYRIFRDLCKAGYSVTGVHPAAGKVCGRTIYRSLKDIDPVPDQVVTVVSPSVTERIVEECHALGIPAIWMQPGSESDRAVQKAVQYGISAVTDRCIMVDEGLW